MKILPLKTVKFIKKFHREVEATSTVEYAIMLMAIVVICLNLIKILGGSVAGSYGNTAESIGTASGN